MNLFVDLDRELCSASKGNILPSCHDGQSSLRSSYASGARLESERSASGCLGSQALPSASRREHAQSQLACSQTVDRCAPSHTYDPSLSIVEQIAGIAHGVLDALTHGLLPTMQFASEQDSGQLADSGSSQAMSMPSNVTHSAEAQQSQQCNLNVAPLDNSVVHSQQSKAGLQISTSNQKVTDRFCRALTLMDTIHVRARTFDNEQC
jgi:hypothetical protein